MLARFAKFVLLLALLVLPLQGMASALSSLVCTGHDTAADAAVETSDGHHHAAAHDDAVVHDHSVGGTGGNANSDHSNHLCCHHFASAAPAAVDKAPNTDLPVFVPALSSLETLFVPEKPQRPPRG
jgi:hypothetical protein